VDLGLSFAAALTVRARRKKKVPGKAARWGCGVARSGRCVVAGGSGLAQGIGASDQIIKDKPDMAHAFVTAALHGMNDIVGDLATAADDFVKFVPGWQGRVGQVKAAFYYYDKLVYPGQSELGEVNSERLAKLQDFYLRKVLFGKGRQSKNSTPMRLSNNPFIQGSDVPWRE
jgi:hypothetical protein